MALVSIAEAAKLVGKSRRTIYNDLHSGKLSASQDCTDFKAVETSELIRVYGAFVAQLHSSKPVQIAQDCTPQESLKIAILEAENSHLRERLADKDKMILLLEDKRTHRAWWKIF